MRWPSRCKAGPVLSRPEATPLRSKLCKHCALILRRERMKRLRMIGLALAAAVCAGQANAEELSGTLRKIKETGAIIIGYRDSSIPFSYLDDNQKPIGFAIDICYKIADAVKNDLQHDKIPAEFNPVTSSTRIPFLANRTIDLQSSSTP